jgi:hypothetical protein
MVSTDSVSSLKWEGCQELVTQTPLTSCPTIVQGSLLHLQADILIMFQAGRKEKNKRAKTDGHPVTDAVPTYITLVRTDHMASTTCEGV